MGDLHPGTVSKKRKILVVPIAPSFRPIPTPLHHRIERLPSPPRCPVRGSLAMYSINPDLFVLLLVNSLNTGAAGPHLVGTPHIQAYATSQRNNPGMF